MNFSEGRIPCDYYPYGFKYWLHNGLLKYMIGECSSNDLYIFRHSMSYTNDIIRKTYKEFREEALLGISSLGVKYPELTKIKEESEEKYVKTLYDVLVGAELCLEWEYLEKKQIIVLETAYMNSKLYNIDLILELFDVVREKYSIPDDPAELVLKYKNTWVDEYEKAKKAALISLSKDDQKSDFVEYFT